jgi:hypothetical protein
LRVRHISIARRYSYKGFKAYQPLNCWWAEQGAMLYSEFRDGNVPAGHEQLRVLQTCLSHLPASVTRVSLLAGCAAHGRRDPS